jgi:phenylacetate-CoA ligase
MQPADVSFSMMNRFTAEERRRRERMDRVEIERYQVERLNRLLEAILPANRFYADKLAAVRKPVGELAEIRNWPFTFKQELVTTNREGAANLTWPVDRYSRLHQTSGTHGRPLVVLDTAEDWQWWIDCWQYVLDAAELTSADRVLMAFSFGPFIGFWCAYDAVVARGALVIPTGGMSTLARLELARASQATVLCCTPSYALHLVEVAATHELEVASLGIRKLIVAGEPGGSVAAVRERLESAWQAKVIDHAGATEVGAWGYGTMDRGGVYVNECEFIAEFLSLSTGEAAKEGQEAELVLTTLGRAGSPAIRYRTGDVVRPIWRTQGERRFVFLEGGVIGRTDDMLIVRGVNVFPSAVDQIVRSFPEVVEYRTTVHTSAAMDQLLVEIEDRLGQVDRVANELRLRLGLNVEVQCVPLGSLPRFEGKGRRFLDRRDRR